jgi:hypothetical protein
MEEASEQVGVAVKISASIRDIHCSKLGRDMPMLAVDLRFIPQSLEENPVVLFRLGHDIFLLKFPFINLLTIRSVKSDTNGFCELRISV